MNEVCCLLCIKIDDSRRCCFFLFSFLPSFSTSNSTAQNSTLKLSAWWVYIFDVKLLFYDFWLFSLVLSWWFVENIVKIFLVQFFPLFSDTQKSKISRKISILSPFATCTTSKSTIEKLKKFIDDDSYLIRMNANERSN